MRYILVLSLFLIGCAGPERHHKLRIDPELQEYVTSFETESTNHNRPIKINNLIAKFGNTSYLGEDVVGYCIHSYTPRIVINREYWDEAELLERENLMFHELGHCILNREHLNDLTNGIPSSIMNEYLIKHRVYELYRAYYLNELFSI